MELVPILSTIILVGTVATFLLAVFAYIMYKWRERQTPDENRAQPALREEPHVLVSPRPYYVDPTPSEPPPRATQVRREEPIRREQPESQDGYRDDPRVEPRQEKPAAVHTPPRVEEEPVMVERREPIRTARESFLREYTEAGYVPVKPVESSAEDGPETPVADSTGRSAWM